MPKIGLKIIEIDTVVAVTNTYRVRQIKVIPYRVLQIFQQRVGIFTRKFIRLFINHIYV